MSSKSVFSAGKKKNHLKSSVCLLLCSGPCSEQPLLFPQFPIYRTCARGSELLKTPIDRAAKTDYAGSGEKKVKYLRKTA